MTSQAQRTAITVSGKVLALIIIVVAVSLVSAIVYFQLLTANNSLGYQVETLELANEHIWGNQTGWFEAAIVVVNTGEKDAILSRTTVRSVESPWSDIYYWKTNMGPPSAELKQTPTELSGSTFNITIDGTQQIFQQASGELALKSGWTVALYLRNPGNLTLDDVNLSSKATIAVFSENKLYYKEVVIEVSYVSHAGVYLIKENVSWPSSSSITVVIRNTGTANGKITAVYIGTSYTNVMPATLTSPSSLPVNVNSEEAQSFTIDYDWSPNTRYYFKFTTDTPTILEFSEKSP